MLIARRVVPPACRTSRAACALAVALGLLAVAVPALSQTPTTVTESGDSLHAVWLIPSINVPIPPLVDIDESWGRSQPYTSFGFDSWRFPLLSGLLEDAYDWARELDVCGTLPPLTFSLSASCELNLRGSFRLAIEPLSEVRSGSARVAIDITGAAAPSLTAALAGESVSLTASATMPSAPDLRLSSGRVDGGRMYIDGEMHAGMNARVTALKEFALPFLGFDSSFHYEFPGDGSLQQAAWEVGLIIEVNNVELPSVEGATSSATDVRGPVYRLDVDLDKMLLVLAGKYHKRQSANPRLPQSQRQWHSDRAEDIDDWMSYGDDGLGGTFRLGGDDCAVEVEAHVVDDELHRVVNAKRTLSAGPARIASATYSFSTPVEYGGEARSWISVPGGSGSTLSQTVERCYSYTLFGTRYEVCDTVVEQGRGSASLAGVIVVPLTCPDDVIEVNPTVRVELPSEYALSLVGSGYLSREAGVLQVELPLCSVWSSWDLCVPYPDICYREVCAWLAGCWDVPYPCFRNISFPAFNLGDISLPRIVTYSLRSPTLEATLWTWPERETLTLDIPLEPFEIALIRPDGLTDVHLSSGVGPRREDCGGGEIHTFYAGPGDTVAVTFSDDDPITPAEVHVNGRRAALRPSGAGWEAKIEVLPSDGGRFVEFAVFWDELTEGRMLRGAATETTDGSALWCLTPVVPKAPTLTSPDEGMNLSEAAWTLCEGRPTLYWSEVLGQQLPDGSGSVVAYEITATVVNLDGELITYAGLVEGTPCNPPLREWRMPEPLRDGSAISWTVRAQDLVGRFGERSAEGHFCYVLPVKLPSVHIASSNHIDSSYADPGDEVTIRFETDIPLLITPTVSINDRAVAVEGEGRSWTATRALNTTDRPGHVLFEIVCLRDLPGCCFGGPLVTRTDVTTDGSFVCLLDPRDPPALMTPGDNEIVSGSGGVRFTWISYDGSSPDRPSCPAANHELEFKYPEKVGDDWRMKVLPVITDSEDAWFDMRSADVPIGVWVYWKVRAQDHLGRWTGWSATRKVLFTEVLNVEINIDTTWQDDPTFNCQVGWFFVKFKIDTESNYIVDFDGDDIEIGGTACTEGACTATVYDASDFPGEYIVAVEGMCWTDYGTVTASIPSHAAQDAFGTWNQASRSRDNELLYDAVPPTVTVDKESGQADPTSVSPIWFTVAFSEPVIGFDANCLELGGTALADTVDVHGPYRGRDGGLSRYSVAVSGMSQSGTVTLSVPEFCVTDAAGSGNELSTSTDNEVQYNMP